MSLLVKNNRSDSTLAPDTIRIEERFPQVKAQKLNNAFFQKNITLRRHFEN